MYRVVWSLPQSRHRTVPLPQKIYCAAPFVKIFLGKFIFQKVMFVPCTTYSKKAFGIVSFLISLYRNIDIQRETKLPWLVLLSG